MSTPSRYQIRATGASARSYNFVAARGPQKTTNVLESIGHLVKSCLGGGVVAIHESYMHCGLWTALFLNIFLGAFVGYCMHILVSSAQTMYGRLQQSKMSYPDLAEASFATGPFKSLRKWDKCFRYCVDVTIGLDLFGSCCVYSVIMARSVVQLIEGANWVTKEENLSIRYYIAFLLIPCLLICMITSLKYLAPFSIVADVFISLDLFGSCCVYSVIMARSIVQLIEGANWVTKEENLSIRYYIAFLLIPCLLICMITSLKYLAPFSIVADVFISLDLFGSCCVYSVIMARSIVQLIEGANWVTKEENLSIRYYIAFLLIPCLLICMITSLKYLAPFSIVADVFIMTIAAATVVYGIQAASRPLMEVPGYKSLGGLLEYIGVCVFSMEGVGVSLPIENHMTNPNQFYLVLLGGMSIVTGIVMIIGFFGYYGFGEKARSPITLNYPWAPFPIALKTFMVLVIYVTFALNFWVPFDLVWYYLKKKHPEARHWLWERFYRAIFVAAIVGIAVIFPSVSSFMGLLGSFCLSNMGFIFPAFIQLTVEWEDPGLGFMKWRLFRFLFISIFGVCLCIMGTYLNAKNMIKAVINPDEADSE